MRQTWPSESRNAPLSIKGLQHCLAARNGPVPIQGAGLHALNTFLNDHRSIADLPARAVQVAKLTIAEDVGDDLVHVGDQLDKASHYFTNLMTARGRVQICRGFDCASPATPLLNGMTSCLA